MPLTLESGRDETKELPCLRGFSAPQMKPLRPANTATSPMILDPSNVHAVVETSGTDRIVRFDKVKVSHNLFGERKYRRVRFDSWK